MSQLFVVCIAMALTDMVSGRNLDMAGVLQLNRRKSRIRGGFEILLLLSYAQA